MPAIVVLHTGEYSIYCSSQSAVLAGPQKRVQHQLNEWSASLTSLMPESLGLFPLRHGVSCSQQM